MVDPVKIDPQAIYDTGAIYAQLHIKPSTVERAYKSGALKHSKVGNRVFILGAWILDWLNSSANQRQGVANAG